MVKSKSVVRVLAAIGVLASSVTVAQAGGGAGTAASINVFYECHSIDGGNLGEVVDTYVPSSSQGVSSNLKVGNGVLECFQVDVKVVGGAFINPDPSQRLKCYAVTTKGPKAASDQYEIIDGFGRETVNVSPAVQMICGPSLK